MTNTQPNPPIKPATPSERIDVLGKSLPTSIQELIFEISQSFAKGEFGEAEGKAYAFYKSIVQQPNRKTLIHILSTISQHHPDQEFIIYLLAKALRLDGDFETGERILKQAIARLGTAPLLYTELAYFDFYYERYQEACDHFCQNWQTGRLPHFPELSQFLHKGSEIATRPLAVSPLVSDQSGKKRLGKLLIYSLGGLGDFMQGLRFVRQAYENGWDISLLCFQPEQAFPLYAYVQTLYPAIKFRLDLKHYQPDYFVPSFSLMGLGEARPSRFSPPEPLAFPPQLGLAWERWLKARGFDSKHASKPLIAFSVSGLATNDNEALRRIKLEQFYRELGDQATLLYLALDVPEGEQAWLDQHPQILTPLVTPRDEPYSLLDTVALLSFCDLVITTDSMLAHLSAEQLKETWVMLYDPSEFRWGRDPDTSPFYPTMRLFRQQGRGEDRRGNWQPVFAKIRQELAKRYAKVKPAGMTALAWAEALDKEGETLRALATLSDSLTPHLRPATLEDRAHSTPYALLPPECSETLLRMGIYAAKRGFLQSALQWWQLITTHHPTTPQARQAWLLMARLYENWHEDAKASEAFNQAFLLDSEDEGGGDGEVKINGQLSETIEQYRKNHNYLGVDSLINDPLYQSSWVSLNGLDPMPIYPETLYRLTKQRWQSGDKLSALNLIQACIHLHNNLPRRGIILPFLEKLFDQIPDCDELRKLLAIFYMSEGHYERAYIFLQQALAQFPKEPLYHELLGSHYFYQGQYKQAARHMTPHNKVHLPNYFHTDNRPHPTYVTGPVGVPPLADCRLVNIGEGGVGDNFMFMRYLRPAYQCGWQISYVILPHQTLKALLRAYGERLYTGFETITSHVVGLHYEDKRYSFIETLLLSAEADERVPPPEPLALLAIERQNWQNWLENKNSYQPPQAKPLIGVAVGGRNVNINQFLRHIKLEALAEAITDFGQLLLLDTEVIPENQIWLDVHPEILTPLMQPREEPYSLIDTVALLSFCDLVITTDSMLSVLSGEQLKETWVMLYYPSEFRWGSHPDMSPFYPTMRLFRQQGRGEDRRGNWQPVFVKIRQELAKRYAKVKPAGMTALEWAEALDKEGETLRALSTLSDSLTPYLRPATLAERAHSTPYALLPPECSETLLRMGIYATKRGFLQTALQWWQLITTHHPTTPQALPAWLLIAKLHQQWQETDHLHKAISEINHLYSQPAKPNPPDWLAFITNRITLVNLTWRGELKPGLWQNQKGWDARVNLVISETINQWLKNDDYLAIDDFLTEPKNLAAWIMFKQEVLIPLDPYVLSKLLTEYRQQNQIDASELALDAYYLLIHNLPFRSQVVMPWEILCQQFPEWQNLIVNLAKIYRTDGHYDKAETLVTRALTLHSYANELKELLGLVKFYWGHYTEFSALASIKHDARSDVIAKETMPVVNLPLDTPPFPYSRLINVGNGGIGDNIMFMRYLRDGYQLGWTMQIVLRPRLAPNVALEAYGERLYPPFTMLRTNNLAIHPGDRLTSYGEMMSLAGLPDDRIIPPEPLSLTSEERGHWQDWLERHGYKLDDSPPPLIGIAISGQVNNYNEFLRHIALETMSNLIGNSGRILLLNTHLRPQDEAYLRENPRILAPLMDALDEPYSLVDTAALLSFCDVIITTDSMISVFAGEQLRETWVMLYDPPEFRWGPEGETSPFYPTMQLFRQQGRGANGRGNWQPVLDKIKQELAKRYAKVKPAGMTGLAWAKALDQEGETLRALSTLSDSLTPHLRPATLAQRANSTPYALLPEDRCETLLWMGVYAAKRGFLQTALQWWQIITKSHPNSPQALPAWLLIANIHNEWLESEEAEEAIIQAIAIISNSHLISSAETATMVMKIGTFIKENSSREFIAKLTSPQIMSFIGKTEVDMNSVLKASVSPNAQEDEEQLYGEFRQNWRSLVLKGDYAGADRAKQDFLNRYPIYTSQFLTEASQYLLSQNIFPSGEVEDFTPYEAKVFPFINEFLWCMDKQRNYTALVNFLESERAKSMIMETERVATLAKYLRYLGRLEEVKKALQTALKTYPSDTGLLMEWGFQQIYDGEIRQGYRDLSQIWHTPERLTSSGSALLRRFSPWYLPSGANVQAKRVWVLQRDGFGNLIQYLRFIKKLILDGAEVTLQMNEKTRAIESYVRGAVPGIKLSYDLLEEGMFDYITISESLPNWALTDWHNLPPPSRWQPPFEEVRRWQDWLDKHSASNKPRIGFAIGGEMSNHNDHLRSMRLAAYYEHFAPLATLVNLQTDMWTVDRAFLQSNPAILNPMTEINSFADSAAMLESLDLVLCVDSGLGHLAGNQLRPVWQMLYDPAEYRWMAERSDSPWYPTMRLFRQQGRGFQGQGDWSRVLPTVATALSNYLAKR